MKVSDKKIAVCSRSFSKHPILKAELLQHFSNVDFNDQGKSLEGQELIDFLKNAEGAIVALEKIEESVLSQLSQLKVISKYGVGLDNLDFEALKKHQIELGHTPGVNRRSVSELVLGYIFTFLRKLNTHNNSLKTGLWKNEGGELLSSKTIGIIGAGHVGKDLIHLLQGFGCRILFNDPLKMPHLENSQITQVELPELLKNCEIISVHIPYSASNNQFLNKDRLSQLKTGSILINTSRGGIVDEQALFNLLDQGKIRGAAMDVYLQEPDTTNRLFGLDNFIGTPHVGGSSDEAVLAMGRAAIENLVNLLRKQ